MAEDAGAQGIVDVVVDVGDPVDEADDPALERPRRTGPGVIDDAVANGLAEVEAAPVALEAVDDPQRMLVVAKAHAVPVLEAAVEDLLADMSERGVPEVVAERDRLGQVLVERERARDGARDAGGLQSVREPRPVVVP